jgi:hypothetical protein
MTWSLLAWLPAMAKNSGFNATIEPLAYRR